MDENIKKAITLLSEELNMSEKDIINIGKASDYFLKEIKILDGVEWIFSYGELQMRHKEMPIWIYMNNEKDFLKCHDKVYDIYQKYEKDFEKIELCVYFYYKLTDEKYRGLFFFSTKDFINKIIVGEKVDVNNIDESLYTDLTPDMIYIGCFYETKSLR